MEEGHRWVRGEGGEGGDVAVGEALHHQRPSCQLRVSYRVRH
jgi:hypothetical protein